MKDKQGGLLTIEARPAFQNIEIGESIAINGCCLTVVKEEGSHLSFDVSDETMRKTALGTLLEETTVNLERAMQKDDRFGGHFVLGHVDTVGLVKAISEEGGSWRYTISYPKDFAHLLIEKGSVTVNGISLTVCDLTNESFSLYIIPHTLKETNLGELKPGHSVNLEFDVLGKYVARLQETQTTRAGM